MLSYSRLVTCDNHILIQHKDFLHLLLLLWLIIQVKENIFFFKYEFGNSLRRIGSVKSLGLLIVYKLYFHCHFDYIFFRIR
jgi:hypothetical protein